MRCLPADVVECNYLFFLVLNHHQAEARHFVLHPVAHFCIPTFVRHQKPAFREDRSPFQLVDGRQVIELIGKRGSDLCRDCFQRKSRDMKLVHHLCGTRTAAHGRRHCVTRWSLTAIHPPTNSRLIAIVISSISTVHISRVDEGSEYSLPEVSPYWSRKSM